MCLFTLARLQAHWDYRKSQHENFARLGIMLRHQSRQEVARINTTGKVVDGPIKVLVPEAAQVKHDMSHVRGESNRVPGAVSEDECSYLSTLIAKHGDDYRRMARDMKLNPYQHTAARLRRRCIRYLNWQKYLAKQKEAAAAAAAASAPAEETKASADAVDESDDDV